MMDDQKATVLEQSRRDDRRGRRIAWAIWWLFMLLLFGTVWMLDNLPHTI